MSSIAYDVQRAIAIIRLENHPVNGLSHALRLALLEGLDRALDDSQVKAIVVTGSQRAFSAGADVKELGTPKSLQAPILRSVIEALEESNKPVIAAIQGVCWAVA
ncbi:putative enoyl-CoA hydratase [Oligella ureolytica]